LRSTLILYDLFKEIFKMGNWGVTDSCLEQQNEVIKPCVNDFWVAYDELGLGFHWRRRENEEGTERRKRKKEKNERTGSLSFYIDAWTGSVQTRSSFPAF